MARVTDTALPARLADGSLAGEWTLDPARSTLKLHTRSMWGMAPVNGVFRTLSGEGLVSGDGAISGTIVVDAASIDTKIKKRDEHLRSADFFDVANHPQITFTAQHVTATESGLTVDGLLRARDLAEPLSVPVAVTVVDGGTVQLDAEVVVDRSAFGMTWSPMRMAAMKNTITVRAVFVRR